MYSLLENMYIYIINSLEMETNPHKKLILLLLGFFFFFKKSRGLITPNNNK